MALISCQTKNNNKAKSASTDTLQRIRNTSQQTHDTTGGLDIADTANYANLPYWNSEKRRYSDAYIDTFSVAGNRFRFVNPIATNRTGGNADALQQMINGKWFKTDIILEDNIHGAEFEHDLDINGDGFADIYNTQRYVADIYFFNPATNTFLTKPLEDFNLDFFTLDSIKHIYCDFHQFKALCGQIHSTLYTFKGFEKTNLYDLELYNCNGEPGVITMFILNKCINDSTIKNIDTVKLKAPINIWGYDDHGLYPDGTDEYFHYKAYWKRRYKKLLSIE